MCPKENECPYESEHNNIIKCAECKKLFIYFQLNNYLLNSYLNSDFACIYNDSQSFSHVEGEDFNINNLFYTHPVLVANSLDVNSIKISKNLLKCKLVQIIDFIPMIIIVTLLSILFILITFCVYMYWKTYSILCKLLNNVFH
jgi:hypothetical protein